MAAAYAEEIGATYLETSAKDDLNVSNIFVQLGKNSFFNQYINNRKFSALLSLCHFLDNKFF